MARWYVLQGPYQSKQSANGGIDSLVGDGWERGRLRVIRLRDRTGPSVAERLAAVEADLLDLRTRVGDLEREPDVDDTPPAPRGPTYAATTAHGTGPVLRPAESYYDAPAAPAEPRNPVRGLGRERARIGANGDLAEAMEAMHEAGAWVGAVCAAMAPYVGGDDPGECTPENVGALVAAWQEQREEIAALRADLAATHSHVESAHRDGRNKERADVVEHVGAAKAAAAPDGETRDPLTDPQPGDYLLHTDGTIIAVRKRVVVFDLLLGDREDGEPMRPLRAPPTTAPSFAARFGGQVRPMTLAEVAAFKRDGTWPAMRATKGAK